MPRSASPRVHAPSARVGTLIPSAVKRVVASEWQLVILKKLGEQTGLENVPKEEIIQAAAETGLEQKWIRKWLSRRRVHQRAHPRSSTAEASISSESTTGTPLLPKDSLNAGQPVALPKNGGGVNRVLLPNPSGEGTKPGDQGTSNLQGHPSPALSGTPNSVQVAHPGTSFTVPLRSPILHPEASADPTQALSDDIFNMRSSTRSPSLGYIPLAFPVTYVPAGHQAYVDSSPDSSGDIDLATAQLQYPIGPFDVDAVPQVPSVQSHIETGYAQDRSSPDMMYLSQLLLETSQPGALDTVSVPLPVSSAPSDFSVRSRVTYSMYSSSLVPSTYSTLAAQASASTVRFGPLPVAFKTRFGDLAALTKRIRATFEEDVLSACQPQDLQALLGNDYMRQGPPWDTDPRIDRRTSNSQEDTTSENSLNATSADSSSFDTLNSSDSSTSDTSQVISAALTGPERGKAESVADEDTDDDQDELLTPSGDIPSFIDSFSSSRKSAGDGHDGLAVPVVVAGGMEEL
ncbi:hypothetical protein CERSUDRAFT_92648 [Gelatoporia subvermispora B]|uniref:Homeobox domain-containing protein n=1 Tax=Ceriporiopsis subvermispora (strain B) TaxID=914234 RepID=M2PTU8_CERS8|nr:hypothetical protein CERSUDRAFT_92648 [Gelatoporia subvermispora B]